MIILLFLSLVSYSSSATRSLKYISTSGLFGRLTCIVQLDGQQFMHYDDDEEKMIPDTMWMNQLIADNPYQLGKEAQDKKREQEDLFFLQYRIIAHFDEYTDRYDHGLMLSYGCEFSEKNPDHTVRGFQKYIYNGTDFLTLDLNTLTWIPANDEVQQFLNRISWDVTKTEARIWKYRLENECINNLKLYLKYSITADNKNPVPDLNTFSDSWSVQTHHTIMDVLLGIIFTISALCIIAVVICFCRKSYCKPVPAVTMSELQERQNQNEGGE